MTAVTASGSVTQTHQRLLKKEPANKTRPRQREIIIPLEVGGHDKPGGPDERWCSQRDISRISADLALRGLNPKQNHSPPCQQEVIRADDSVNISDQNKVIVGSQDKTTHT